MWPFAILLAAAFSADERSGHEQAVGAIRQLGGSVEVRDAPGHPVVVGLTGSKEPSACLPLLRHLTNLHTLDL
jgi:hypothetical protein